MAILENTPQEVDELLTLRKKKYYNLIPSTTRLTRDVILGLLSALDSENFLTRKRYDLIKDETGATVKRILAQIVIIDHEQKRLTKRFYSDFMMQNDATFNTNKNGLLLFMAIGITNTNYTFPAAFSFTTLELEICYNFFLSVLIEEVFNDRLPPRVNILDQGKGLLASLPHMIPGIQI